MSRDTKKTEKERSQGLLSFKVHVWLFTLLLSGSMVWVASRQPPIPRAVGLPAEDQAGHPLIADSSYEPFQEDEALQQQRRTVWKQWLASAEKIAADTSDKEAQAVVQFLKGNACLAIPVPIGAQFIDSGEGKPNWVAIITLLPGDEKRGERWSGYANDSGVNAHFLPNERTLILKSHIATSPIWQGVTLLHEGHHAYTFMNHPYDWTDQETFCSKERDTHAFQNRVVAALDKRYNTFLAQEVQRMRLELKQNKGVVGTHFPDRTEYLPALDDLFGPAQSPFERDARQTHFWMHACFSLLEQDFKGDVETQKALFLRTLYDKDGILPIKK